MADYHIFNYPIETPEAIKFWSSDHKCNRAKAFIAFSLDEDNYRELAKRHGYTREWRDRAWDAFGFYVNTPDMSGIPFTEVDTNYWDCMPNLNIGTELEQAPYIIGLTPSWNDVPYNQPFTLTVDATGAPVITYQWYKDNVLIGGATGSTYTIPSFTEVDDGVYHVVASNSYGDTKSPLVTLEADLPAPIVTLDPVDQVVSEGGTATFTAAATGYDSVQWLDNGVEISGATAISVGVVGDYSASGNTGHRFSAVFTNSRHTATTNTALLTVTPNIPVITLQPQDTNVLNGELLVLTANATGYDSLQWFKYDRTVNKYVVVDEGDGTFADTVYHSGLYDSYYVEFTNGGHTVRSRTAQVFVSSELYIPVDYIPIENSPDWSIAGSTPTVTEIVGGNYRVLGTTLPSEALIYGPVGIPLLGDNVVSTQKVLSVSAGALDTTYINAVRIIDAHNFIGYKATALAYEMYEVVGGISRRLDKILPTDPEFNPIPAINDVVSLVTDGGTITLIVNGSSYIQPVQTTHKVQGGGGMVVGSWSTVATDVMTDYDFNIITPGVPISSFGSGFSNGFQ